MRIGAHVSTSNSADLAIDRALDIGAMGLLVPMVKTVSEARVIVSATRFPPEGTRGFGPLRASSYTMDNEDYFKRANDNTLVAQSLALYPEKPNTTSSVAVSDELYKDILASIRRSRSTLRMSQVAFSEPSVDIQQMLHRGRGQFERSRNPGRGNQSSDPRRHVAC